MKDGNLYILTYDLDQVPFEDLQAVAKSLDNALNSYDKLIIVPNTIQLRKVSTEELIELQMHIDNILDGRRSKLE